jgi:hypothetical protein
MDAVRRLKSWRAAVPAGMWAELLAAACDSPAYRERFHRLVIAALRDGMPAAAKQSELLPFFKKGDAAAPGNYRGIQLISILRKVVALIVSKDLCRRLEPTLLEYQCGFRPQRGCADQLFALRRLAEMSVEWQQRMYVGFVDLRKAFDSLHRPALWAILRSRDIPEQLVRTLEDLHTDTTCCVRLAGRRSRRFGMEYGVQQGCPLANPLFNVFFDHVVREAIAACPGSGITLRRRREMGAELGPPPPTRRAADPRLVDLTIPVLMLADDLAVLAPTAEGLRSFMAALEAACARWGLVISSEKTELMLMAGGAALACEVCGRQDKGGTMVVCDACGRGWHTDCAGLPRVPADRWQCAACMQGPDGGHAWKPAIAIGGRPLAWVDLFRYLGSTYHETGDLDAELSRRIQLAAAAFWRLLGQFFRQRCIRIRTRLLVYDCVVTSVLLYGSEAWGLSAGQLERLEVFHRKCLRHIVGWRLTARLSNAELYSRCGGTRTIAARLDLRQLRWLGHLGRMDEGRLAKQLLYGTMHAPDRRRRVGRPSTHVHLLTRYADLAQAVRDSLRRPGSRPSPGTTWFSLCQNRTGWSGLLADVKLRHCQ